MRKIITTFLLCVMFLGCMAQDQESWYPQLPYQYTHDKLNSPKKVKGGAGIVQFMKAVDMYYYDEEDPEYAVVDKANGYYNFSQEGGGGLFIEAAYWNRSDGKKMLIVRYHVCDFGMGKHAGKLEKENAWFKLKTQKLDGDNFLIDEIGFMAYLYNAATQTLEPMQKPPFNGVPATSDCILINPPQKGKDIKVQLWSREKLDNDQITTHTLKFNGLTFDWVK
ncbi:MAG: hypothetical protein MJZ61_08100 [Bacteroidales bacterium]|nr:hypothetical protein [Bacteroidales bacterium]